MLTMQDEMNRKIHPDWRAQNYEWYRAIWIECAELMDHHGWKWWKKQSPDREQVILELIDIWHFGLSDLLQKGRSGEDLINEVLASTNTSQEHKDFLSSVEQFSGKTLLTKSFDISGFMLLLEQMNVSFDHLYRSYVGKNVLNFFRQDKGYKEGTYIKVWSEKEDNQHLVEILDVLDSSSATYRADVYAELEKRYPA
jgi:dimeric dUTPase (all-alpha-NTP-PPase superfamily)